MIFRGLILTIAFFHPEGGRNLYTCHISAQPAPFWLSFPTRTGGLEALAIYSMSSEASKFYSSLWSSHPHGCAVQSCHNAQPHLDPIMTDKTFSKVIGIHIDIKLLHGGGVIKTLLGFCCVYIAFLSIIALRSLGFKNVFWNSRHCYLLQKYHFFKVYTIQCMESHKNLSRG